MNLVVPCVETVRIIEPYTPKVKTGFPPFALQTMLRSLSDQVVARINHPLIFSDAHTINDVISAWCIRRASVSCLYQVVQIRRKAGRHKVLLAWLDHSIRTTPKGTVVIRILSKPRVLVDFWIYSDF